MAGTGAGPDANRRGEPGPVPGGAPAGVVLAAGAGTRLRPLTRLRPKALCPVGAVPLVDLALARVAPACSAVAVNVHHGRALLEAHLADRPGVHLSIEEERALGTAGALGLLRDWLDGRPALVVNADTWCHPDLAAFVEGWDGERVRVLVHGDGFGPAAGIAASLLPWREVRRLEPVPSGLYERCWAPAAAAGRLDVSVHDGPFVDCGTPAAYLRANLLAAAEAGGSIIATGASVQGLVESSVVGAGAVVAGTLRCSVVWDGVEVGAGEVLDHAVRADRRLTLLIR